MLQKIQIESLLDLSHTIAKDLFKDKIYPWDVLKDIGSFIIKIGCTLPKDQYDEIKENVWVAKNASIAPTACINGPAIICNNAEIRHCAYVRGNAIIGENTVVGNSTELKNVILFDNVQVPHYNYVGDSILGYKAHMGAGSITSNVKSDKTNVSIKIDNNKISTGLKKFGAILGDNCEVGCNAVLNPGSIVSRNCSIYPLSMVRGFIAENSIYKNKNEIIQKV